MNENKRWPENKITIKFKTPSSLHLELIYTEEKYFHQTQKEMIISCTDLIQASDLSEMCIRDLSSVEL